MKRSLCFSARSIVIGLWLCASVVATAYAQQPNWKAKKVVLNCDHGSMQQALEQVAAQAGISILAEGTPARKPFMGRAEASAEQALAQIAGDCDYTWSLSKSGVVLLTKRFTDEHDRPDVVPAEMRAVAHDMLTAVQTIYTPPPARTTLSAQFRALFAALTPEQVAAGASGRGLLVASLAEPLRGQAVQTIYTEEFSKVYLDWHNFEKHMEALPQSRLVTVARSDMQGNSLRAIVLADPNTPLDTSRWLWSKEDTENKSVEEEPVVPPPATPPPLGLLRANTVGEALDILRDRFHIAVTLAPRMGERRVLLLLHKADAGRIVAALAELHNWRYQEKDQGAQQGRKQGANPAQPANAPDKAQAYFMYRRAFDTPRTFAEMGQAILAALPPDMARCLFTKPSTLDGKPYIDFHKMYPMLPGADNPTEFTYTKITRQKDAALHRLRHSFAPDTFAAPVPYAALTTQQKRDLIYYLFSYAVQQTLDQLWTLTHNPPDWLVDPLRAAIIQRGDSYGILRADGNIGFLVHENTFTPPAAPPKVP